MGFGLTWARRAEARKKAEAEAAAKEQEPAKQEEEKAFTCEHCGKECGTPMALASHKRWKHPLKG